MSCLSLKTAAPHPCLPLGIKDSLKEDMRVFGCGMLLAEGRLLDGGRLFDGGFW
jgi:hypothetical protein